MGKQTGALPDGRLAGEPLAHGLAPQCGSATRGLTAALKSATSLNLKDVGGGASMMFDLDSSWQPEVVDAVVETFIARGGTSSRAIRAISKGCWMRASIRKGTGI